MKKFITNSNVIFNHWYNVEEYSIPFWVMDTFEFQQILVCNKEEIGNEGVHIVDVECKPVEALSFESIYVDEDPVKVTHFMIPWI